MAEKDLVARLAALARLELTDSEATGLAHDLGAILEHVARLQTLQLAGVAATYWTAEAAQGMRADECRPGLTVEDALASAAARSGRSLLVPGMREDA